MRKPLRGGGCKTFLTGKKMLATLKNWLQQSRETNQVLAQNDTELAFIVTSLMLEAAAADGEIDEEERQLIFSAVSEQFSLSDEQMKTLFEQAEADAEERIELHGLLRKLREQADYEERVGVLELVWMVVLADNRLDQLEAQLMRRLAGLLFISDVDSGLAAQAARTRLGLA